MTVVTVVTEMTVVTVVTVVTKQKLFPKKKNFTVFFLQIFSSFFTKNQFHQKTQIVMKLKKLKL